ncbi:MAG: DUF5615 family PIN-like protein, partial [Candidatus Nanohaloarchaea archaeon]|nr:DUF5615 family PIN-like protein [Candidatus Nanohaloarchaea archaeon]
ERATAHLIVDESVDLVLVEKIRGRGFNVGLSPREKEYEDVDVLRFAVERQAPLLTTDSDFRTPPLDTHFGILLDTDMNRRDPGQVADAITGRFRRVEALFLLLSLSSSLSTRWLISPLRR